MKASKTSFGISIMLLLIIAVIPHELILAQDQESMLVEHQDTRTFRSANYCLKLPLFDTIRPTLCNSGKGLLYYECIFLEYQDKTYLFKQLGEESPVMMKASFTDIELEMLKQNLLIINKEYSIQIKEWIRKDKLDLNLGEAIRGFHMQPIEF